MTGFLVHLAGMALGQAPPGAVRAAVLPRFASAQARADMPHDEPRDEPPARPEPRLPKPSLPLPETAATARVDRRPLRPVPRAEEYAAPAPRSGNGSADRSRPDAGAVKPAGPAPLPDHAPMASPVARSIPPPRDAAAPPPPGGAVPSPVARPAAPPIAETSPARTPLSQAAVASRVRGPRDESTVIQVTIDRIDLRTPDLARSDPAAKPGRRPPTISLADYLRRGDGGGRR